MQNNLSPFYSARNVSVLKIKTNGKEINCKMNNRIHGCALQLCPNGSRQKESKIPSKVYCNFLTLIT